MVHTTPMLLKRLSQSSDGKLLTRGEGRVITEPLEGLDVITWQVQDVRIRYPQPGEPNVRYTYYISGPSLGFGLQPDQVFHFAETLLLVGFLVGDKVWHDWSGFEVYEVMGVKQAWNRREVTWEEVDEDSGALKTYSDEESVDSRLVYDIKDEKGEIIRGVEKDVLVMYVKGPNWPA